MITVGATDRQGNRAFYSNFGSRIDIMAPGGEAAPDAVLSLGKNASNAFDYVYSAGTSMATPHVAGLAALMKAIKPTITQAEVRQILASTARPLSTAQCVGGETEVSIPAGACGAGLVDAARALESINTSPTPTPTPTPNPTPVDLAGTLVGACVLENGSCRANTTVQQTITESGSSVSYLLRGLSTDSVYVLEAYKDVNNNGREDAGDYYSFLQNIRPSAEVDIELGVINDTAVMRLLNAASAR
jgi:serine protease